MKQLASFSAKIKASFPKMAAESLNQLILEKVNENGSVDSLRLSEEINKDHQLLVGAVKSLQTLGNVSMSKKKGPFFFRRA